MRYAVLAGVLFVATAAYGIPTPTPSWTPRPATATPTPVCPVDFPYCTCGRLVSEGLNQRAALHAAQDIRLTSPADVTAMRNNLIQYLWKGFGIPTRTPVVTLNVPQPGMPYVAGPLPHIAQVDKYEVAVPAGASPLFHATLYHWFSNVTGPGTGKVVLITGGHDDLWPGNTNFLVPDLLADGYDIIGGWMALFGPNTGPLPAHDHVTADWAPLETTSFAPITAFLEPSIVALNYALTAHTYSQVIATGWSGGGWTTMALAAIDTRIQLSYPVAGSIPCWINSGNREQDSVTHAVCFGSCNDYEAGNGNAPYGIDAIATNQEKYILGAAPAPRRQIQIGNFGDDNLGGGVVYKAYSMIEQIKGAQAGADWKYWLDMSSMSHQISPVADDLIRKDIAGVRYADQEDYGFWQSGLWANVPQIGFQYSTASIGSGGGANTVSWSIPPPGDVPLANGTYRVSVTYPPMSPANTSSVVFQLFDGAAFIGQGIVNEQLTPGDINERHYR